MSNGEWDVRDRLTRLETQMEGMKGLPDRMTRLESRQEETHRVIKGVDQKIDGVIEGIEKERQAGIMSNRFLWTTGLAALAVLVSALALFLGIL